MQCPKCSQEVELDHKHNAAHGIEGTHMAGSERYECPSCDHHIHKIEGEALDLKFILD